MIHLLLLWFLLPLVWRHGRGREEDSPEWTGPARRPPGPSQEARVFGIAARNLGTVTVSDVVIELGCSVSAAETLLQGMTDSVRVVMLVDDRGRVRYEFPELKHRWREATPDVENHTDDRPDVEQPD